MSLVPSRLLHRVSGRDQEASQARRKRATTTTFKLRVIGELDTGHKKRGCISPLLARGREPLKPEIAQIGRNQKSGHLGIIAQPITPQLWHRVQESEGSR